MARHVLLAFLICLCTGMVAPQASRAAEAVAVTVSIPPQKYFVERIGGDAVTVTVMTGKGRDPHSYEPTVAQMRAVEKSALYIAMGVPFETQWLPKFRALNPSLRVLSLMDSIERLKGRPDLALRDAGHTHGHSGHGHHHHGLETDDPHAWLAPKAMMQTIPATVDALTKIRPDMAETFAARGKALAADMAALDKRITTLFAPVPAEKRLFLTFHQSWTYYAHNFGLREVSVELEGREPSPKAMAQLLEFAKKNSIRVIVADPMTSKSSLAAIAKSLGAAVITANPLDEDWPGALSAFSESLAKALP